MTAHPCRAEIWAVINRETYVASDAVAEEIVQETWMAIVTGIDRFEGRSALGAWIFSILINQAKTHSARERRAVPLSCVAASAPMSRGNWATPPRP